MNEIFFVFVGKQKRRFCYKVPTKIMDGLDKFLDWSLCDSWEGLGCFPATQDQTASLSPGSPPGFVHVSAAPSGAASVENAAESSVSVQDASPSTNAAGSNSSVTQAAAEEECHCHRRLAKGAPRCRVSAVERVVFKDEQRTEKFVRLPLPIYKLTKELCTGEVVSGVITSSVPKSVLKGYFSKRGKNEKQPFPRGCFLIQTALLVEASAVHFELDPFVKSERRDVEIYKPKKRFTMEALSEFANAHIVPVMLLDSRVYGSLERPFLVAGEVALAFFCKILAEIPSTLIGQRVRECIDDEIWSVGLFSLDENPHECKPKERRRRRCTRPCSGALRKAIQEIGGEVPEKLNCSDNLSAAAILLSLLSKMFRIGAKFHAFCEALTNLYMDRKNWKNPLEDYNGAWKEFQNFCAANVRVADFSRSRLMPMCAERCAIFNSDTKVWEVLAAPVHCVGFNGCRFLLAPNRLTDEFLDTDVFAQSDQILINPNSREQLKQLRAPYKLVPFKELKIADTPLEALGELPLSLLKSATQIIHHEAAHHVAECRLRQLLLQQETETHRCEYCAASTVVETLRALVKNPSMVEFLERFDKMLQDPSAVTSRTEMIELFKKAKNGLGLGLRLVRFSGCDDDIPSRSLSVEDSFRAPKQQD